MTTNELPIYEVIARLKAIGEIIGYSAPVRLSSGEPFAIVTETGSAAVHRQPPVAHALITTNLNDHRA